MIIFDTETTALVAPEAAPIDQQPHIIEFAAIEISDSTLEYERKISFLCRPPVIIPPENVALTGITNEMVKKEKPFAAYVDELTHFFFGKEIAVAHFIAFDISVLRWELERLEMVTKFPWPPIQICTVEKNLHIKGHRMNLSDIHQYYCKKPHTEAHRAMADVEALTRVVIEMKKKEVI